MTFNPLAASSSIESFFLINGNNKSALDIGAQTPSISTDFIESLIKKYNQLDKSQIENLNLLKEKTMKKIQFTTHEFFLSIGFKIYNSIDINGAYESFEFDLNKDILSVYKFKKKYDLVINNGTGEHIFNQYSLFLNMHNVTKKNGLMLHLLPFIDWINHGFYNFNPIFFAGVLCFTFFLLPTPHPPPSAAEDGLQLRRELLSCGRLLLGSCFWELFLGGPSRSEILRPNIKPIS